VTRPRTLVVDENFPNAGRDAGSVAIVSHIKSLIRLGHETHFLATSRKPVSGPLAERLLATGCKLAGQGGETVVQTIATAARDFQFIYAQRRDATQTVVDSARGGAARIVYGLADLHHIRLARQAVVQKNSKLLELAAASSRQELALARQAYAVITPSTFEADLLRKDAPGANVHAIPWAVGTVANPPPWRLRDGVLFVGGYAHAPNVDAAAFLVRKIMPLVWATRPDVTCILAGSHMPASIRSLAGPRVRILGYVEDLTALLCSVRLTVAPLRFGAGLKGKVLDSLAAGVPCVMTPIAAEGFDLPPELAALVGLTPGEIAAKIASVFADETSFQRLSSAATALANARFSRQVIDGLMARIFGRHETAVDR
jgi:glycosyltransferase involved in cell wall biosynthesis